MSIQQSKDVYLVIGGSGFVGSHIVQQLLDRGDSVSIFDIVQRNHDVPFYSGDISEEGSILKALQKVGVLCIVMQIFFLINYTERGNLYNPYRVTSSWTRPCYLLESKRGGHEGGHIRSPGPWRTKTCVHQLSRCRIQRPGSLQC